MSREALIRGYFAAYLANQRDVVAAVLTDDFTFTSPYDDAIDRDTYFARCWPDEQVFRSITVERVREDGDATFVLCHCEMLDGKTFRNIELHRFRDDRLQAVEVYFGAAYRGGAFIPLNPSR